MSLPAPSNLRKDLTSAALELVGTTLFLLLGLGGIQASTAEKLASTSGVTNVEQVLYISTCMGFSLVACAWMFFRITGSLFNPCITVALVLLGILPPVRGLLFFFAQFLGSILASALLLWLTGTLSVNTYIRSGITPTQGVFIEMFITSALVVSVLMLASEKHQATAFAPVGIGLTLFSCHLWAVHYTGASMNTARSFGPALLTGFSSSYHWVYWVGPFLGSILGSAFYAVCKHQKYWTLNPHQDANDHTESPDDTVVAAQAMIEERNLTLNPRGLVSQISDQLPKLGVANRTSARERSSSTLVAEGPLVSAV
ncbi:aquaporin-like protein [Mycena rosella]|uniref:Aquaporin-like protein n=1 Tax=Mycena rosella TaxID=1033263 RepID=A0AAD7CVK0_MYCRO|nr:aquaporin-like protein [Mycena rosella]